MMKRFIAAVCALAVVVGCGAALPERALEKTAVTASAEEPIRTWSYGRLTYTEYEDHIKVGSNDSYSGPQTVVNIPAQVSGKPVTELAEHIFWYDETLEEVTIPGTVKDIPQMAFEGCPKLRKVTLNEGIETIGLAAFDYCRALLEVDIPESVRFINGSAFSHSEIGMVYGCGGLERMGDGAFAGTPWYNARRDDEALTLLGSCLAVCGERVTGTVNIPEGITCVGGGAFREITSVEKVTFPKTLKYIEGSAFRGCAADMVLNAPNLEYIGTAAFFGCYGITAAYIPEGVEDIGVYAFNSCYRLEEVSIVEGVVTINSLAFYECPMLKEVFVPKSVKTVGYNALGIVDVVNDKGELEAEVDPEFRISGYEGTAAEDYARENGIPFNGELLPPRTGVRVSGSVYGGPKLLEGADLYFTSEKGEVTRAEMDGSGFSIELPAGEYVVNAVCEGYAPREYNFDLTHGDVTGADVEIHRFGDIDGDGDVKGMDAAAASAHIKGTKVLSGYDLKVADVDHDGDYDAMDAAAISAHVKGVKLIK